MNAAGFTLAGDPHAEARIGRDLDAIADDATRSLGDDLAALVLVGGYARGEGAIGPHRDGPGPSNDYDLVAVMRRAPRDLDTKLRALSSRQTERAGVDVDVWPISHSFLSRAPATLFWLDASRGGARVLAGDAHVLDALPPRAPSRVPLAEAGRLLANRAVGLALSTLETPEREPARAIRHAHKAALAVGDAWLLASGRYAPTLVARTAALTALRDAPALGPDLVAAWNDALLYRRDTARWTVPARDGALAPWFDRVRALVGRSHLAFEAMRVGTPRAAEDFAHARDPLFDGCDDLRPGASYVASLRLAREGVRAFRPWVGHPRERLARAAVALAYADRTRALSVAATLLGGPADADSLRARLVRLAARGG